MTPPSAAFVPIVPWIPPVETRQRPPADARNPRGVLLLNEAFAPLIDGVINVVENLYRSLAERDIHTHVVTSSMPGYVDTHERITRLPSLPLYFSRPYRWPMPTKASWYLPRDLHEKIDVVHLHSGFANARAVSRWARQHGKPVLFTVHTKFRDKFVHAVGDVMGGLIYKGLLSFIKQADIVTCPGQLSLEQLIEDGIPKEKLRLVKNGVSEWPETTAEQRERMMLTDPLAKRVNEARAAGKAIFVFVGQHIREKNPQLLMRSLSLLKAQGMGFLCMFVGGGDQTQALMRQATKLGVRDDVVFVGRVMDRVRLSMIYALADLMTFPSTFETSGLVAMEAAQHGLPTVGILGSSGIGENIRDGENGFLAPLDAQKYAQRVREALSDDIALARVRHAAAQTVARSKDAMIDDFLQIYREMTPARAKLYAFAR